VPTTERTDLPFSRIVLPSGITIVGERMESVRSAAIGVWIRVGSRHEASAEAGMTHFLEHVVFKGTGRRDALQIALAIESVGGHLDAFTGREVTCFNARVLEEHLDLAVDVLSDLALHPRIDPVEVEKEKGVIIEEIHNYEDTPDDRVHDLFSDVVWRGHPLGNRILGTEESVRAFSREAIAGYHARHYTAPNLLVSIAGRFDWDRVVSLVESNFGNAAAGSPERQLPAVTEGRGVIHHQRDLAQQYLCVGGAGLPHEHPDRYALVLLSTLLGGGMSSRLFQRVREQEGLAYSVYTYADSYSDAGIFCASMSVQPVHGRKAVRATLEEFDRVAEEGVPAEELQSVKAQLKGNLLLGLESTTNQMTRLARAEIYSGRYVSVDELIACVDRITEADVKRLAREVVARDSLCLVALGPSDGAPYAPGDLANGSGDRAGAAAG
jgi:predicted Zn-dependent peptidase